MTGGPTLEVSVRIAASPDEVFQYFTDPALMVKWLGEWAELDPVPGGVFAVTVGETRARGLFVQVQAPHRVVFTWGVSDSDGLPAGSTTVEVVLTQEGEDTIVVLTHRDLPPNQLPPHRVGWTTHLGQLRLLMEPRGQAGN